MSTIDADTLAMLGFSSQGQKRNDRLGQTEFLKLMVTQLENQDPFKPMESGEFLGQLAQFGTVSGIEDLQRSFSQFSQSVMSGQALQAASLVDRSVMVSADSISMDPAEGMRAAVELLASASEVTVGVYNGAGELVRRLPLGSREAGVQSFHWDGRNESGELLPPGVYEFAAVGDYGFGSMALDVYLSGRVESVSLGNHQGALMLQVEGVGEVNFNKVRQIG